jgi:hypothetical protein
MAELLLERVIEEKRPLELLGLMSRMRLLSRRTGIGFARDPPRLRLTLRRLRRKGG